MRGTNLEIARGQSISLRGESGAGETTFKRNSKIGISDFGEIYWDGQRVDNLSNSSSALRAGFMGFVFQNYCLVGTKRPRKCGACSAHCRKFDASARKRAKNSWIVWGFPAAEALAVSNVGRRKTACGYCKGGYEQSARDFGR
ncbi:MAG: ATP-binding cassette domain-containing protein [Bacilli bacterium]